MRRANLLALLAVLCLAQSGRDDYRAAYDAWRKADPGLEREASAGGAPIAQRADRMAAEAAKAAAARRAYLEETAAEQFRQIARLESAGAGAEPAATNTKPDVQFIDTEKARVARTMEAFAADPDKGIQHLRQALAREKAALDALTLAVVERQKSADAVEMATAAIHPSRDKSLDHARAMLAGLNEASAETAREGESWAEYYRKLEEAAQGTAAPITQVPAGVPPATLANPAPAPPTVTPVPLARYVGAWTWPQTNGLFHGLQPESVDVLVHEDNGRVTGSAFGRFKLAAGSTGDPVLRFDFAGELQTARNQVFHLVTSDGTKGTIELIPGPAFNLLEVNIQTEAKPGKIGQADMVLVKK